MSPEYDKGDLLIKRVANGWLLTTGGDEEGCVINFVYEDNPSSHHSLYALLADHFAVYMRTKREGGLEVSVHDKGSHEEG